MWLFLGSFVGLEGVAGVFVRRRRLRSKVQVGLCDSTPRPERGWRTHGRDRTVGARSRARSVLQTPAQRRPSRLELALHVGRLKVEHDPGRLLAPPPYVAVGSNGEAALARLEAEPAVGFVAPLGSSTGSPSTPAT
jgi:hypothetical protein